MTAQKSAALIKQLIISTGALAVVSASLLMFIIVRPVEIKEVEAAGPGQVTYDLGDGRKITAPGDGIIEWEGELARNTTPSESTRTDTADAQGVKFNSRGSGSSLIMELDFGQPETSIDGGATSVAGYANIGVKALFTSGALPLYIIAAISIIVGCVLWFWLKATKLGLGFIVGGITLLAVVHLFTTYPWVLLILLLIAVVIVGIILWDYWKKKGTDSTVTAIVAAGESLPTAMKSIFTKNVRAEAGARGAAGATRKVVTTIKASGKGNPQVTIDTTTEEKALYEELKHKHDPPQPAPQLLVMPAPVPPVPPA